MQNARRFKQSLHRGRTKQLSRLSQQNAIHLEHVLGENPLWLHSLTQCQTVCDLLLHCFCRPVVDGQSMPGRKTFREAEISRKRPQASPDRAPLQVWHRACAACQGSCHFLDFRTSPTRGRHAKHSSGLLANFDGTFSTACSKRSLARSSLDKALLLTVTTHDSLVSRSYTSSSLSPAISLHKLRQVCKPG